ncbi:TcpE family conjugal transfer membrane protein [Nonomuraea sp. NPDC048826]|uniref:TcpE family conjugal transfer membrane protein n=1 Tax=Nonomuraea sp. NPDC048826 TaxID=3364347 RepID=UPI003719431B
MDLPTYTNIWRIEKRLYKLYDLRLPMPLPIVWIGVFVGVLVPWSLLLWVVGVPVAMPWHVLFLVPPGIVTWLSTRPVIEGKRLTELLESQLRYLGEPKAWYRLASLSEPDTVTFSARVWRAYPVRVKASRKARPARKTSRKRAPATGPRQVRPAVAAAAAAAAQAPVAPAQLTVTDRLPAAAEQVRTGWGSRTRPGAPPALPAQDVAAVEPAPEQAPVRELRLVRETGAPEPPRPAERVQDDDQAILAEATGAPSPNVSRTEEPAREDTGGRRPRQGAGAKPIDTEALRRLRKLAASADGPPTAVAGAGAERVHEDEAARSQHRKGQPPKLNSALLVEAQRSWAPLSPDSRPVTLSRPLRDRGPEQTFPLRRDDTSSAPRDIGEGAPPEESRSAETPDAALPTQDPSATASQGRDAPEASDAGPAAKAPSGGTGASEVSDAASSAGSHAPEASSARLVDASPGTQEGRGEAAGTTGETGTPGAKTSAEAQAGTTEGSSGPHAPAGQAGPGEAERDDHGQPAERDGLGESAKRPEHGEPVKRPGHGESVGRDGRGEAARPERGATDATEAAGPEGVVAAERAGATAVGSGEAAGAPGSASATRDEAGSEEQPPPVAGAARRRGLRAVTGSEPAEQGESEAPVAREQETRPRRSGEDPKAGRVARSEAERHEGPGGRRPEARGAESRRDEGSTGAGSVPGASPGARAEGRRDVEALKAEKRGVESRDAERRRDVAARDAEGRDAERRRDVEARGAGARDRDAEARDADGRDVEEREAEAQGVAGRRDGRSAPALEAAGGEPQEAEQGDGRRDGDGGIVPGPRAGEAKVRRVESVVGRDSGGWRRVARVVVGGNGMRGDGSEIDEARARSVFAGSRRVVVLGCTGGAGQSTTALMLGHTLAQYRDDRVVAVDAGSGASTLTSRIEPETPETLTSLLAGLHQVGGYLRMRGYTTRTSSGLEVVGADGDAEAEQRLADRSLFSDDRLGDALALLDRHYKLTVIDPAAALAARVLPYADQLVLVVPASEEASEAVEMTYEWLDGHGCAALRRRAVMVVNGVSRRSMPDVEQAEAVASGRCRAIVRVPWEDDLAPGGVEVVDPGRLRTAGRRAYLALAGVVVAGFAAQKVRPSEEELASDPPGTRIGER